MVSRIAVALATVLLLLAPGCGAGGEPNLARGASSGWMTNAFGGSPDVVMVYRLADAYADPYYGALLRKAGDGGLSDPRMLSLTSIEGYLAFGPNGLDDRRVMIVLRGVPPGVDPVSLTLDRKPIVNPTVQKFPSGVIELTSSGRRYPGAALFVLPDHTTWVIVDARTAVRASALFWSSASPPPRPDDGGALASAWLGPGAVGATAAAAIQLGETVPGLVGLQEVRVAVRPSQEHAITASATYEHADQTEPLIEVLDHMRQCTDRKCADMRAEIAKWARVEVSRSGRELTLKAVLTEAALAMIAGDKG